MRAYLFRGIPIEEVAAGAPRGQATPVRVEAAQASLKKAAECLSSAQALVAQWAELLERLAPTDVCTNQCKACEERERRWPSGGEATMTAEGVTTDGKRFKGSK